MITITKQYNVYHAKAAKNALLLMTAEKHSLYNSLLRTMRECKGKFLLIQDKSFADGTTEYKKLFADGSTQFYKKAEFLKETAKHK